MLNLAKRSSEPELLDGADIPFDDIKQNMQELNVVNKYLGGHAISLRAIKRMLVERKHQEISICEIGCGGGDNLAVIATWCLKNNIKARFIGIDIKHACIEFAREQYPELQCTWIASDFKKVQFEENPTIIFSSLFCHHFADDEIIAMLGWMRHNSLLGFFINDLHRHPLAYYAIKTLTTLFSNSYLVKNDAPLSVARSFTRKEWEALLHSAGIKNYHISWEWAFRHLISWQK